MKKKMLSALLILCMLVTFLPVTAGAASLKAGSADYESLRNFLGQFAWCGLSSYDAQNAARSTPSHEYSSKNILEAVIGNASCCNFSLYPVQQPEDFWGKPDPLGKWEEHRKSDAAGVDWILKNIFNCSDADISAMRDSLASSRDYYYRNNSYYTNIGGMGGGFVVRLLDMEQNGQRYHVYYSVASSYTPDRVDYNRYAVVEQKTVGGKKYWTLHAYSDQPIADNSSMAPGEFRDVKEGDYFYDAVRWAVDQELATGTGGGMFSPGKACTVAEALTMLWRANGSPLVSDYTIFSNMSDQYYFTAARWAVKRGLISRTGFTPSAPCTRSMFVKYLWTLAGEPVSRTYSFSDVPAGADYAKAVSWAVGSGIAAGTSSTAFSPNGACTRAQIVTLLWRNAGNGRLTPPTPAATAPASSWSDAYRNFVLNEEYLSCPLSYTPDDLPWGSESEPNVSLHDFDSDGVPELLMTNGYDGRVMRYAHVFTFANGTVQSIGIGPTDAYYVEDPKFTGIFGYFHIAVTDHSWTYYQKSGGQIKSERVRLVEYEKVTERTDNDELFAKRDEDMCRLPYASTSEIRSMGWDSFVEKALAR